MIKVNGTVIPTPSAYQVDIQDIVGANVCRNANGDLIMDRIATKRKIIMSWNYLSQADLSGLLRIINSGGAYVPSEGSPSFPFKSSGIFFYVEYVDPEEDGLKTGVFYVGDRSVEAIDYRNGVVRWKNAKFNFIER